MTMRYSNKTIIFLLGLFSISCQTGGGSYYMTVQSPATSTTPLSSPPISPVTSDDLVRHPLTTSPQLVAMKARINAEWRDLVYREALRMTGALRQILGQSNNSSRSQLVRSSV